MHQKPVEDMTHPIPPALTDNQEVVVRNLSGGNRMQRGTGMLLISVAFLLAYGESTAWAVPIWLDFRGHYSHGLLVAGLVAYLLWAARNRLSGDEPTPASSALISAGIVLASSAWFVSALAGARVPGVLAALTVGWLAMSAALGRGGLWRLAPYFALLASAIPLWQPLLNPPLQVLAIQVVNHILRALGLTIFMDGNTIVMPQLTFEIVGGCSGLGYVLVAFTLSMYLVLSSEMRLRSATILVGGFLALALVSNWLRIATIMLVGYHYGRNHPLVYDHVWFGWVVFSVIFLPALYLAVRRWPTLEAQQSVQGKGPQANVGRSAITRLFVAMLAFPFLYLVLEVHGRIITTEPSHLEPALNSPYRPVEDSTEWQPSFPGATRTSQQAYHDAMDSEGQDVYLYQAHYAHQSDGAEIVDRLNDFGGAGWTQSIEAGVDTQFAGAERPVGETQLTNASGARMLVWFWYRVGDSQVSTERHARIEEVLWKLRLRSDAAVIALAALCNRTDCTSARRTLQRFSTSLSTGQPESS